MIGGCGLTARLDERVFFFILTRAQGVGQKVLDPDLTL